MFQSAGKGIMSGNNDSRSHYPKVCAALPLQTIEPGLFDKDDLTWEAIAWQGKPNLAAKIARARLSDFVEGEKVRGCTQILCSNRVAQKKNLLVDDKYGCYCGKHAMSSQSCL